MYSFAISKKEYKEVCEWYDTRKPTLLKLCNENIEGNFSLNLLLRGNSSESAIPTIVITYANLKISVDEFKTLVQEVPTENIKGIGKKLSSIKEEVIADPVAIEILECSGWGWQ